MRAAWSSRVNPSLVITIYILYIYIYYRCTYRYINRYMHIYMRAAWSLLHDCCATLDGIELSLGITICIYDKFSYR